MIWFYTKSTFPFTKMFSYFTCITLHFIVRVKVKFVLSKENSWFSVTLLPFTSILLRYIKHSGSWLVLSHDIPTQTTSSYGNSTSKIRERKYKFFKSNILKTTNGQRQLQNSHITSLESPQCHSWLLCYCGFPLDFLFFLKCCPCFVFVFYELLLKT